MKLTSTHDSIAKRTLQWTHNGQSKNATKEYLEKEIWRNIMEATGFD